MRGSDGAALLPEEGGGGSRRLERCPAHPRTAPRSWGSSRRARRGFVYLSHVVYCPARKSLVELCRLFLHLGGVVDCFLLLRFGRNYCR